MPKGLVLPISIPFGTKVNLICRKGWKWADTPSGNRTHDLVHSKIERYHYTSRGYISRLTFLLYKYFYFLRPLISFFWWCAVLIVYVHTYGIVTKPDKSNKENINTYILSNKWSLQICDPGWIRTNALVYEASTR